MNDPQSPPGPAGPPPAAPRDPFGGPRIPFVAILLIALGALFLAGNLRMVEIRDVIRDWWPAALIVLGITHLINHPRAGVFSGVLMLVGGSVLLAFTLGYLPWRWVGRLWPLVLIAIGISMLFPSGGRLRR